MYVSFQLIFWVKSRSIHTQVFSQITPNDASNCHLPAERSTITKDPEGSQAEAPKVFTKLDSVCDLRKRDFRVLCTQRGETNNEINGVPFS